MRHTDPTGNDFALIPDDGPHRLLRFGGMVNSHLLSTLDKEKNILKINPTEYDRLPERERIRLDTTHLVTTKVIEDDLGIRFVDAAVLKAH